MSTTKVYWPYLVPSGLGVALGDLAKLREVLEDADADTEELIDLVSGAIVAIDELFGRSEWSLEGRYFTLVEED